MNNAVFAYAFQRYMLAIFLPGFGNRFQRHIQTTNVRIRTVRFARTGIVRFAADGKFRGISFLPFFSRRHQRPDRNRRQKTVAFAFGRHRFFRNFAPDDIRRAGCPQSPPQRHFGFHLVSFAAELDGNRMPEDSARIRIISVNIRIRRFRHAAVVTDVAEIMIRHHLTGYAVVINADLIMQMIRKLKFFRNHRIHQNGIGYGHKTFGSAFSGFPGLNNAGRTEIPDGNVSDLRHVRH